MASIDIGMKQFVAMAVGVDTCISLQKKAILNLFFRLSYDIVLAMFYCLTRFDILSF